MTAFRNEFVSSRMSFCCLVGAPLFLSNPDYQALDLVTVPLALIAFFTLTRRINRQLLVVFYLLFSVYGFVVGRLCFEDHRLTTVGYLLVLVPVCIGTLFSMYNNEPRRFDPGAGP